MNRPLPPPGSGSTPPFGPGGPRGPGGPGGQGGPGGPPGPDPGGQAAGILGLVGIFLGIGLLLVIPIFVALPILLSSNISVEVGLPLAAAAVIVPFIVHIVIQRRMATSDDPRRKAMGHAMRAMLIVALALWGLGLLIVGLCIALLVSAFQ